MYINFFINDKLIDNYEIFRFLQNVCLLCTRYIVQTISFLFLQPFGCLQLRPRKFI